MQLYKQAMSITFDPAKRDQTLRDRGLDFAAAKDVFSGATIDFEDTGRDYGEVRMITVGAFQGRMVIIAWTQRGTDRHVFSMRKAN